MKRLLSPTVLLILLSKIAFTQVADFDIPDTVCVNENININNTTVGGSTFYWNFCSGDLNTSPSGSNLGNVGSLNKPVFIATAQDGNDFYTFVTNNGSDGDRRGTLSRQSYGNSLLNTPTGINFGDFGGALPWGLEGIQIVKDGNNWYGIVVGGGNEEWLGGSTFNKLYTDAIIRLEFGNSLANTPTATNMGNIGNLDYPHDLYIFKDTVTNNWHGLTCNALNNTITRFDFGNSLANVPTGTNLGNIGNLNYPDGIFPINDNGNWHVFVASRDNNSVVRLDFGSSLLNTPTGINLGNVGGLDLPRDISIIKDCDDIFGFVVNQGNSQIVKLDFSGGITSSISGTSLGNIGSFSFPHTLSDVFRVDDGVYIMVANVNNNTLSRLVFSNCTNSSIPSSTAVNPPPFSYDTPGTYNVSLFVDDALATKSIKCKPVVVVNKALAPVVAGTSVCQNTSATLTVTSAGGPFSWYDAASGGNLLHTGTSFTTPALTISTTYYVESNASACASASASVTVSVRQSASTPPAILQVVCAGNSVTFGVPFPIATYNWYDSPTASTPIFTGDSFTTAPLTADTFFWYESVFNECPSPRVAVAAQIITVTTPSASSVSVCEGAAVTLSTGNVCDWYDAASGGALVHIGSSLTLAAVNKDTTFYVEHTQNGCSSARAPIKVSVNPIPASPSISDVEICIGDVATLNAFTSTGFIEWFDALSGGNLIHSGSSLSLSGLVTDTTVFVSTISNECSSQRIPAKVKVNPLPLVDAGANQRICTGSSVQLTGTGALTYTWTPAASLNNPSIANPIASPTASTTYTLTASDANGCVGSDVVIVDLGGKIQVHAGNDVSICKNDAIMLNASGGVNYSWSPATGLSDANIPNPIANPSVTTTYTLTANDGFGCSGDTSITLTVNDLLVLSATPHKMICLGDTIDLTVSGALTYAWDPSGSLKTVSGASVKASPTSNTIYTVTGTDANGCTATANISVDVSIPVITAQTNAKAICKGDSTTLSVQGATIYSWSPTNGLKLSAGQQIKASPAATITYTVIGIDSLGCSAMATVSVGVENVEAKFMVPNACLGNAVNFNNQSTGAVNWNWNFGNGMSSTQQNPSNAFNTIGNHTVVLTAFSPLGCVDTFSTNLQVEDVLADFSASTLEGVGPLHVDFSDASNNAVKLSWDFGDGNTSATQNPSHTFDQPGDHLVYLNVESANGCKDVATKIIKVKAPKSRLEVPNVFSPNRDGVNDLFSVNHEGLVAFSGTIFNRWGAVIYSWDRPGQDWDGRTNTGVECGQGTYFYLITGEGVDGEQYENEGFVTLLR